MNIFHRTSKCQKNRTGLPAPSHKRSAETGPRHRRTAPRATVGRGRHQSTRPECARRGVIAPFSPTPKGRRRRPPQRDKPVIRARRATSGSPPRNEPWLQPGNRSPTGLTRVTGSGQPVALLRRAWRQPLRLRTGPRQVATVSTPSGIALQCGPARQQCPSGATRQR